jgi:tetratricopeptide (TPR) repeat protein
LGYELARLGRDDEGARTYETAFADSTLDPVAIANKSGWLVRHYAAHNRVGPALQLADRVAHTGAFAGLTTAAHLYEQLGRADDAEAMYEQSMRSYDNFSELLGFYYRAVEVRHKQEYAQEWHEALAHVFPNGLNDTPVPDAKPSVGVHIASDSPMARKVGLQAGDIIVAVDGFQVTNLPQYYAVRAFPEAGPFTLTLWRGHLINVKIADRWFVPEFHIENYPVQGWIER